MSGLIFDSPPITRAASSISTGPGSPRRPAGAGVAGVVGVPPIMPPARAPWPWPTNPDFVWAALGVHPESLIQENASTRTRFGGDWAAKLAAIRPLIRTSKAVAVGEAGLDYHWPVPKDAQLALFEAQLKTALELEKPIIVHDREAHADTYALLKKYRPKGVVHCFSGSAEDALELARQGLFIGLGGAVTFGAQSARSR